MTSELGDQSTRRYKHGGGKGKARGKGGANGKGGSGERTTMKII